MWIMPQLYVDKQIMKKPGDAEAKLSTVPTPGTHELNVVGKACHPGRTQRDGRYQRRRRAINSEMELLTGTDQVVFPQLVQLSTAVDNPVGFFAPVGA